MLQGQWPGQKTRSMTDIITFGVGNSTILNKDGKTKILSYVACPLLLKMFSENRFLGSCLLKNMLSPRAQGGKTHNAIGSYWTCSPRKTTELCCQTDFSLLSPEVSEPLCGNYST